MFHISKLKKYIRSEEILWEVQPPLPVMVEDHLECEVEDHIQHRGKGSSQEHLVLWKGYSFIEDTCEYERDFVNVP